MIHELFDNIYWKIVVVIVLSLLVTFVNEIDALKDGVIVYMILAMLCLLIYTKEDVGFTVLVGALFVLSYNNVVYKNMKTGNNDVDISKY